MGIYDDLQKAALEMLRPDQLGQVGITLVRETQGTPDPDQPWLEVPPTKQEEVLRAVSQSATDFADGTMVMLTDTIVISAKPTINWKPQTGVIYRLKVGDQPTLTVYHTKTIPPTGPTVAVRFFAR